MLDGVTHGWDGELSQIVVGSDQYGDIFILRHPNIRISWPKKKDTARSGGGREMRNSGIVANKGAVRQDCGQMRQWERVSKPNAPLTFE